jgi:hypothetical protein
VNPALVTLAWLTLMLVHTPPALATFSAKLRRRMYGVDENGQLGVILAHRGVLFLAVALVCLYAALLPGDGRRSAAVVVTISLVGFLALYLGTKLPKGPLRPIAIVDALALAPLAVVIIDAWRL